jgi:integrase/recombinase XerD
METKEDLIFNEYKDYLQNRYKKETAARKIKAVIFLKKYLKDKSFLNFNENDFLKLTEHLFNKEYTPYKKLSPVTQTEHIYKIRSFYTWLKQKGYIETNPLKDFKRKEYIELARSRLKNNQSDQKKRKYNNREILRAYWHYLRKNYNGIGNIKTMLNNIKLFIDYNSKHGKTVYEVERSNVTSFIKYLNAYEYQQGLKYLESRRISILREIKRFYLWFTCNGHLERSPFEIFPESKFLKELKKEKTEKPPQTLLYDNPPDTFKEEFEIIIKYINSLNLAYKTIRSHKRSYWIFFNYLKIKGIEDIQNLKAMHILDYHSYIKTLKNVRNKVIGKSSQKRLLADLKLMLRYFLRIKHLKEDFSEMVEVPKQETGIPRTYMSQRELNVLFEMPDLKTDIGFRDRTIMELLYSTGIRVNELVHIKINNINWEEELILIEEAKGGISYQRVIPCGRIALEFMNIYKRKVRIKYSKRGEEYFFVSIKGSRLKKENIMNMILSYRNKAGLRNKITSHSFRVTCATDMLKNKADIRHVQEQLGHKSILTTQKYTRIFPMDLKKVHKKTHPRG